MVVATNIRNIALGQNFIARDGHEYTKCPITYGRKYNKNLHEFQVTMYNACRRTDDATTVYYAVGPDEVIVADNDGVRIDKDSTSVVSVCQALGIF